MSTLVYKHTVSAAESMMISSESRITFLRDRHTKQKKKKKLSGDHRIVRLDSYVCPGPIHCLAVLHTEKQAFQCTTLQSWE